MGQARNRGTFNERRTGALIRIEKKRLDDLNEQLEIEKNMTPEEKARRAEARMKAAIYLIMASGAGVTIS